MSEFKTTVNPSRNMKKNQYITKDENNSYALFIVGDRRANPIALEVFINQVPIQMEFDTAELL